MASSGIVQAEAFISLLSMLPRNNIRTVIFSLTIGFKNGSYIIWFSTKTLVKSVFCSKFIILLVSKRFSMKMINIFHDNKKYLRHSHYSRLGMCNQFSFRVRLGLQTIVWFAKL